MQFFLDFIKENKILSNLFNSISKNPGHQGTVIRFSETFLSLFAIIRKFSKDEIPSMFYRWEYFLKYGYDFDKIYGMPFVYNIETKISSEIGFTEIEKFRNLIPENVDKALFNPIEIVISVFNDAEIEIFEQIIKDYDSEESFKVLIERRGRNTFLNTRMSHDPLTGGISISGNNDQTYGTLGGFLKTPNLCRLGLTCSHVVSNKNGPVFQPAKCDSPKNSRRIGKVLLSSSLNFCDPQTPCNTESSQGNMDVTLIQLEELENLKLSSTELAVHELGKINKLKEFKELNQGMSVEFNGRTTNERKQLSIGGLCVSYKIAYEQGDTTQYACFTNLIELRSTPIKLFGPYHCFQDSPVRAGDSGAWICSNDSNGYAWCGMLISGDIDRGYFLSSEHILNWINNNDGYQLNI